jgi:hypothetical protein
MATQGPWTIFNRAKSKFTDGTIVFGSHAFNMVLLGSAQTLSATFTGTSGDCRYADLTAELTTGSGYASGGTGMSSLSVTRVTSTTVAWNGTGTWTPSGSLTWKYAAIYDATTTTKDLVCFCDMDTGGGTVTATSGTNIIFTPGSNGIIGYS